MSNNNYLDEVYTVGENNRDHREDSSGDDSYRDQRRGRQNSTMQSLILQL